MKQSLEKIRVPERRPRRVQLAVTAAVILCGFALGVLQKWLDAVPVNRLPAWLQALDLGNYFGRLAIWILLGTVLSVYSDSPFRASVNVFAFFMSMLAEYYLYCNFVLGFLPWTYMAVWLGIALASVFPAYLCWYARGRGCPAILISGGVLGVLLAQACSLTQGLYVCHTAELITWLAGVLLLRRPPKEFAAELGLSLAVALLWQLFLPHFG